MADSPLRVIKTCLNHMHQGFHKIFQLHYSHWTIASMLVFEPTDRHFDWRLIGLAAGTYLEIKSNKEKCLSVWNLPRIVFEWKKRRQRRQCRRRRQRDSARKWNGGCVSLWVWSQSPTTLFDHAIKMWNVEDPQWRTFVRMRLTTSWGC